MNFKELKEAYEYEVVSTEQFNEIAENEEVDIVQNNGTSGSVDNAMWYTACDEYGDEFDFYTLIGYKGV